MPHTPGPWTSHAFGTRGGDGPSCFRISGANGEEIADTYDYTALDGGNAALIAEAPNLLHQLEVIVAEVEVARQYGDDICITTTTSERWLANAIAAIAKAKESAHA